MHVLGTAGHVDHGKSSLLRVLTGMEPSRLAEERRRGMTMQLGYVWTTGPEDETVGIIDVPGHADYRLAMLSGASALDAFLFVCAADDGWMPQSEEHLWALRALGITAGVVALTKCDLVTTERLADLQAELEVRFFEALGREVVERRADASGDGLRRFRFGVAHADDAENHPLVAEAVEGCQIEVGLGRFDRDLVDL